MHLTTVRMRLSISPPTLPSAREISALSMLFRIATRRQWMPCIPKRICASCCFHSRLCGYRSRVSPAPSRRKCGFKHKRLPILGGPADDEELYEISVGIENDSEPHATDFRLDVEIPASCVDGGAHMIEKKWDKPGVRLFRISHTDRKIEHLISPQGRTRRSSARGWFEAPARGRQVFR